MIWSLALIALVLIFALVNRIRSMNLRSHRLGKLVAFLNYNLRKLRDHLRFQVIRGFLKKWLTQILLLLFAIQILYDKCMRVALFIRFNICLNSLILLLHSVMPAGAITVITIAIALI